MKKIIFMDIDDYHEIPFITDILNLAVEKGHKKYKGLEVGFDYNKGKFVGLFYCGPYPKNEIKIMKEKLDRIENSFP